MSQWMCIVLFAGLVMATGCEQRPAERAPRPVTSEDVRRDAAKAATTANQFASQTKEEFQQQLEAKLKQVDADIARLQEQGRDLQGDAKANWDQKMGDLKMKREAASARLAELRQSSAEAWQDLQKGTQSAWDELDQAFRDAAREFDTQPQ